jgi:Tetratricopeptide repeat
MPTRRFRVRGILIATGNLAVTYRKQRQLDKAAVLHKTVLDMNKTVLGEWHLDTVEAMGDLAAMYWKPGRLDKAFGIEETVLDARKTVLG